MNNKASSNVKGLNSLFIIGVPIFFNKTKFIFLDLFFLSLSINDNILLASFFLKNLFSDDGNLEKVIWFIIDL